MSIINVHLDEYVSVHTPTKAKTGGALIYIKSSLDINIRIDLILLKSKELKSVFIEVNNSKKSNLTVGCLYRHHFFN